MHRLNPPLSTHIHTTTTATAAAATSLYPSIPVPPPHPLPPPVVEMWSIQRLPTSRRRVALKGVIPLKCKSQFLKTNYAQR